MRSMSGWFILSLSLDDPFYRGAAPRHARI